MSAYGITAENVENNPGHWFDADIEKQWAVKSFHHAETYFKLISSIPPRKIKLTKIDNEIYTAFRNEFPKLNITEIDEMEFKSEQAKAKWRNFIMQLFWLTQIWK